VPKVFAHFAKPLNQLRERHGLPPIGSLPEVITFGDYVLHPDVPELAPTGGAPRTHIRLGHVPWSPRVPLPSLAGLDPRRPLVYVTLGSSGKWDRLPLVLRALAYLPVNVLVSTAGRRDPLPEYDNVRVAAYVPGDLAAQKAALVITNGGASTAYQALAAGRPVVGIPHNLDQYLAMTAIAATGAGVLLRSGTLRPEAVSQSVVNLLDADAAQRAAARIRQAMSRYDHAARFRAFVESVTCSPGPNDELRNLLPDRYLRQSLDAHGDGDRARDRQHRLHLDPDR
jgi:UDP:flavonoid glycosyltransferase YjiC (YdhE family)